MNLVFTLAYSGIIKSSGNRSKRLNKHVIREALHPQLKDLWSKEPYHSFLEKHRPENNYQLNGFEFVPLVTEKDLMFAELDIVLLSAARKGVIGDIDGRLKTILDALRKPHTIEELPDNTVGPSRNDKPFFCLLEDDALVTSLNVRTDALLGKKEADESVLMIKVTVGARRFPV